LADERVVEAASLTVTASGSPPVPLTIANRLVGGGSFFYDPGPPSTGQKGVAGQFDLNNTGLLVTTYGRVGASGTDFFYIEDGSQAQDNSIFRGICVLCDGLTQPAAGQYVIVTGISTLMTYGDGLSRSIRPRDQSDIQIVPGT
jgi:hypothetical protein